jgi:hypothetical protein
MSLSQHTAPRTDAERSPLAASWPSWLCALFVAAVVAISFARLFYGVDMVDESTYVAVPYRFCLGDTPFVDEHTPIQTSALLSLPFVKLFYALRGSSDGIVLYTRVLYFALCCGVAIAVAFGLRPLVGRSAAWVVSSACVAFCPLGIPNLSYNTWSLGWFTIGVFVGVQTLVWRKSTRWLFAAGLAHGFAAIALASYAVPIALYAVGSACLLDRAARTRGVLFYAAGGISAVALFAPWLYRFDRETLDNAYFHARTAGGWMTRVRQFAYQAWIFVPIKIAMIAALALVWIGRSRPRGAVPAAVALAILPLFPLLLRRSTNALWYVAILALLGTALLAIAWRSAISQRFLFAIWLPSSCAGVAVSLTSLNGLFVSGCGLFPAALGGMALAIVLVRELASTTRVRGLRALDLAFPALSIAALVAYQRRPFGDDAVELLDTRVAFGPFHGLYTTPEKARFLSSITDDLSAAALDHESVLFVVHFPAGYLMTSMRPATHCIWTYPCTGGPWDECYSEMRRNIAENRGRALVVARMHAFPTRRDNMWESFPNELDDELDEGFRPIVSRAEYTLFVAK